MRKFVWLLALLPAMAFSQVKTKDMETEELKDGWVRVKTTSYTLEIPKGWDVTAETSFGQREMTSGPAKMSAMTAPGNGGPTNWDSLYQTAVYFSTRGGGKATPYKMSKSKQGYDAMSYSVVKDGFAASRYVILRSPKGDILALSVTIPEVKREADLMKVFDRMVRTANIKV
ncbi:MAG: hypothetical protein ACOYON_05475 [Fimbriimonas sp.]